MFVYSFRAGTVKFLGVVALAVATLFSLMLFVPTYGAAAETGTGEGGAAYENIRTNDDRLAFVRSFGYEVAGEPIDSASFTLPEEFDRVLASYNELQKAAGLDLMPYKKKNVTRYTYPVTNYEGYEGTVYVNLILFRDRVIAADICSADPTGFVHALTAKSATSE